MNATTRTKNKLNERGNSLRVVAQVPRSFGLLKKEMICLGGPWDTKSCLEPPIIFMNRIGWGLCDYHWSWTKAKNEHDKSGCQPNKLCLQCQRIKGEKNETSKLEGNC